MNREEALRIARNYLRNITRGIEYKYCYAFVGRKDGFGFSDYTYEIYVLKNSGVAMSREQYMQFEHRPDDFVIGEFMVDDHMHHEPERRPVNNGPRDNGPRPDTMHANPGMNYKPTNQAKPAQGGMQQNRPNENHGMNAQSNHFGNMQGKPSNNAQPNNRPQQGGNPQGGPKKR